VVLIAVSFIPRFLTDWRIIVLNGSSRLLLYQSGPKFLMSVTECPSNAIGMEKKTGEVKLEMQFPAIYLLHGRGGSPNGSVSQLEAELQTLQPNQNYIRPLMPHTDPAVMPSVSVQHLRNLNVSTGVLIIGVSLGGLVAAKLSSPWCKSGFVGKTF
jgi:hypothetical protein